MALLLKGDELREFLETKVTQFNRPSFIENDPVLIPHRFKKLQDVEISGFFAATLAWGQRKTIINKTSELLRLMDDAPHDFILHHSVNDLRRISAFKHRTFSGTDALYFIDFFKRYYSAHQSLEHAFSDSFKKGGARLALSEFRKIFFNADCAPARTRKHVSSPDRKSACKRLNMFLRWMVRNDSCGVDFGCWKNISSANLICPLDLHVERVARKLKLIRRKAVDWETAEELTRRLRKFDPLDPVKYDFALFGLGLVEKF
ncbi:MAG: TIGR02757 family protein [Cyclobacteriaceae bacterium]